MPRSGRTLELLIARLEAVATAGEADVRSPDYVRGRLSGSNREVDVTVRSKVGSTNVLVAFECRDRAGTEDVTWIEQLGGKRDDIGANVAVAVSGSGFSAGAKTMASRLGIELRTVESITVEDVLGWCSLRHLDVHVFESRRPDLEIGYFSNTPTFATACSPDSAGRERVSLDEPIFAMWDANNQPRPEDPQWLTGKQVHELAMGIYYHDVTMPEFSEWTPVTMRMSTAETPTVAVRTSEGPFPLAYMNAKAEVRTVKSRVPVSLRAVRDDEGGTTQVVEAVAQYGDQGYSVALIHTDKGIQVLLDPHGQAPVPPNDESG